MLPAMLPRRLAATLGALRAAGMPATPSFLRSLTSASATSAGAGAPPPSSAASAAPMPRPKNLRLDKSTLRLVERLRAVEEAKKSYADLQAPNKTLPVLAFASAQPTGALAALPDAVFATPLRADIVHRVIVWQEKNARSTLYKGKGRSEVRGGGRKPWKQKGTGRARVGSIRSPLWVGGGVAHPPKLKGWGTLLQKKVRRLGMRCVLAAKYRDRRLVVVDALRLGEGKTRSAAAALAAHGCAPGRRVLLVDVGPLDALLVRGLANIPGAQALPVLGANVRDIVLADRLFITTAGLEALVARVTKTD